MSYCSPTVTTIGGVEQVVMLCNTGVKEPKNEANVVGLNVKDGKLLIRNYQTLKCLDLRGEK